MHAHFVRYFVRCLIYHYEYIYILDNRSRLIYHDILLYTQ